MTMKACSPSSFVLWLLIAAVIVISSEVDAFIFGSSSGGNSNTNNPWMPASSPPSKNDNAMERRPDLMQVLHDQKNQKLNLALLIYGEEEEDDDPPIMAISKVILELSTQPLSMLQDHASLPAIDGGTERASCSSGHLQLTVLQEGTFVSVVEGQQSVIMTKPCWEVCWCKDRPAGTLILGVGIPHSYHRNEIVLPQGEIYLSFAVWTQAGLEFAHQEKQRIVAELLDCLDERDEALSKKAATNNPLLQVFYHHQANAAIERYNTYDHHTLASIPDLDALIPLQGDMFLSTHGTVWGNVMEEMDGRGSTATPSSWGIMGIASASTASRISKHRHLGFATVSSVDDAD